MILEQGSLAKPERNCHQQARRGPFWSFCRIGEPLVHLIGYQYAALIVFLSNSEEAISGTKCRLTLIDRLLAVALLLKMAYFVKSIHQQFCWIPIRAFHPCGSRAYSFQFFYVCRTRPLFNLIVHASCVSSRIVSIAAGLFRAFGWSLDVCAGAIEASFRVIVHRFETSVDLLYCLRRFTGCGSFNSTIRRHEPWQVKPMKCPREKRRN